MQSKKQTETTVPHDFVATKNATEDGVTVPCNKTTNVSAYNGNHLAVSKKHAHATVRDFPSYMQQSFTISFQSLPEKKPRTMAPASVPSQRAVKLTENDLSSSSYDDGASSDDEEVDRASFEVTYNYDYDDAMDQLDPPPTKIVPTTQPESSDSDCEGPSMSMLEKQVLENVKPTIPGSFDCVVQRGIDGKEDLHQEYTECLLLDIPDLCLDHVLFYLHNGMRSDFVRVARCEKD